MDALQIEQRQRVRHGRDAIAQGSALVDEEDAASPEEAESPSRRLLGLEIDGERLEPELDAEAVGDVA